ncbi:MAG: DNA-3-methyladenine glycosylase I [Methanosphaera sp.]|nr:DNA-3-methyladenine glycosylase I [Methanosphaera sp.]
MVDDNRRCFWCNLENTLYVSYHDNEWSLVTDTSDEYLFELLVLETFQAGLSWEIILNKRENFRSAFDNFDRNKIINYDEEKLEELYNDKTIIRNKQKINATITNAEVFNQIVEEYGSFYDYLQRFTGNKIIYETDKTTSTISDNLSKDLKKHGMKFVGSVTIYSYLQAIGLINSHEKECFLYHE